MHWSRRRSLLYLTSAKKYTTLRIIYMTLLSSWMYSEGLWLQWEENMFSSCGGLFHGRNPTLISHCALEMLCLEWRKLTLYVYSRKKVSHMEPKNWISIEVTRNAMFRMMNGPSAANAWLGSSLSSQEDAWLMSPWPRIVTLYLNELGRRPPTRKQYGWIYEWGCYTIVHLYSWVDETIDNGSIKRPR